MKVLLVHNFYRSLSPSGEDSVYRSEVDLLKSNGIQVVTFERYNDNIRSRIRAAIDSSWSSETYRELKRVLKAERLDIAHFHNIWYMISPSAYFACKDMGIPVVQTLHNYRIFCSNGLLLRKGKICEECIGRLPWSGILHGCYRGSRLYTLPIAIAQSIHGIRNTWNNMVDAFIALTSFGKEKMAEGGILPNKIYIKPHFLENPPDPSYENGEYAVFLGRLSVEKGLDIAIKAFRNLNSFRLKIVGDGPYRNIIDGAVDRYKMRNIELLGMRSFQECMEILKKANFLIMPSICYEGFPMVIREAFACGKPVIASHLGSMAELVEDCKTGFLFEPGNPGDLAEKMKWMIEHEDECLEMGKNARKVFEEKYTEEKNFKILMEIYNSVLSKYK